MLPESDLLRVLTNLSEISFDGVLYRAIDLEALYGFHKPTPYPQPMPLFSFGAPKHGARFTPRNGMPTLYMAEDPDTALAEARQVQNRIMAVNPGAILPHEPTLILDASARLQSVLDLPDAAIQRALRTDLHELTSAWRPLQAQGLIAPTQILGRAVFHTGLFDAIRYPSVRSPDACCLAIFPDRLSPPAFVEVYDPHRNVWERIPP